MTIRTIALATLLAGFLALSTWAMSHVGYFGIFAVALAGPGEAQVFTDLLAERRRSWTMIWDKIPYALVALFFGLRVMGTQPETRNEIELAVIGHSTFMNLWLLTGFGDYVMMRGRPDFPPGTASFFIVAPAILLLPFLVQDGRSRGLNPWPWVVATPLLGSIAPLAYFVYRDVVPSAAPEEALA